MYYLETIIVDDDTPLDDLSFIPEIEWSNDNNIEYKLEYKKIRRDVTLDFIAKIYIKILNQKDEMLYKLTWNKQNDS